MKQSGQNVRVLIVNAMLVVAGAVQANNMSVTNITLVDSDVGYTHVACDVSWDNSWRAAWQEGSSTVTNWDAAWVFVKFRVATNNAPWQHASLSTNNSDHIVPAQAVFNVGTSSNAVSPNVGVGGFLYRKDEGSGTWTNTVKLRWNYAQNGVASTQKVQVSVHAIEMVYVPQGSFKVGSGGTEAGSFTAGPWVSGATTPFAITNEDALMITNDVGSLWGTTSASIGSTGVLAAVYPKGFNAFYCMKYEITQGQWVDFFNMLTDTQKTTRDITGGTYNSTGKGTDSETNRNTIAWISGDASCTTPNRVCNFLKWKDSAAYTDWAGLRPVTELEFEKACRGPLTPVASEYVWGTSFIMDDDGDGTIDLSAPEDGSEVWTNSELAQLGVGGRGAAVYGGNIIRINGVDSGIGPVRAGLFATAASTRSTSGATYWGIMEMGGSMWERCVTVYDTGRLFTGATGDGLLDSNGNANTGFWPSDDYGAGTGLRGAGLESTANNLRTSDRSLATSTSNKRSYSSGFRAVRQASSVVP